MKGSTNHSFHSGSWQPHPISMPLVHDIVRHAGKCQAVRGCFIDHPQEKRQILEHFLELGLDEKTIRESLEAIAPTNLCTAKGIWWLNLIHPTKLCILTDRIIFIRRFLWFKRCFRCERAVMIRHIREVESDFYFFSGSITFRTHRSVEVFTVRKLYKPHVHQATRVIQALLHDELSHGAVPSGDDIT